MVSGESKPRRKVQDGVSPEPSEKHPHEKLDAWKESIQMVKECYAKTDSFPADQRFGLASQIQRAAVSVPANIAEGSARGTPSEARHFYTVARGSLLEVDTLLTIAAELRFLRDEERRTLRTRTDRIAKLLNGLIRYQRERER